MECDPKGAQNMASSYRERVYLGIAEEEHEIIKWASGDSKRELHDSIVRLYGKYGKIDRFLAEVQKPLSGESAKKVVLFHNHKIPPATTRKTAATFYPTPKLHLLPAAEV